MTTWISYIDYAGPFEGMMLLIITDAFSKWLEVKITKSTTATATIMLLDEVFATYGVPLMIVSDNGTNFSSAEFNKYLTRVGVKYHKYTAPYHPATNGQAERNVQTVKNALKAMCTTRATLRENMNEFLRQYRNAPHYTTGQSPAQLFLGRKLRTRLDLIRPEEIKSKVSSKQYLKAKTDYRQLTNNQIIHFLSGNPRMSKWLKGRVVRSLGDIHYEIEFKGKYYKRHIDQIRGTDQHTQNDNRIITMPEKNRDYGNIVNLPAHGDMQHSEISRNNEQQLDDVSTFQNENYTSEIQNGNEQPHNDVSTFQDENCTSEVQNG